MNDTDVQTEDLEAFEMWIQRGMEEIIWLDKVTYEEVSVGQVGMSTSHPFYGNYTGCPFDAAST